MNKYFKRVLGMLTAFCVVSTSFATSAVFAADATEAAPYKQFYVATNGSDDADGSQNSPFKTIERAQEEVRKYNRDMKGNIVVNVASGNYFLDDTIYFHAEDSGFNGYRVIWRGEEGAEKPLISAGRPITGFTKWEGNPNIYVADVENYNHMINYITVNGELRRDASGVEFQHKGHWDDPDTVNKPDGMYVSKSDFALYENMEDMYIEWWDGWIGNYIYLRDAFEDPNNPDQYIVRGYDGMFEFYALSEHEHTGLTERRRVRPRNAFELLDEPGEFYYNRKQGKIYYMPKEGEDMSTAQVIYPRNEDIIYMVGTDRNEPVKNVTIENFQIANSKSYAFEETGGARFGQLSEWKTGGTDTPGGAIELFFTDGIEILNNEIYNAGQTGICFSAEVDNTRIEGNIIRDCGDAGIMVGGVFRYYYRDRFALPNQSEYNPDALCTPGIYRRVQMSYGDRDISGYLGYYRGDYAQQTWLDDSFLDEEGFIRKAARWEGNPESKKLGIRDWVRVDMREAHSWDKIVLHLWPHGNESTRSNFEVLLSNDRFFEEGNYVVAATYTEPTSPITVIDAKDLGKYRYIMVRTLTSNDKIAFTSIYPFTSDVKPYEYDKWPENALIQNNLIARCGNFNYGSGNMGLCWAKNVEIAHNQIQETSYSGIEAGWDWNYNSLVYDDCDIHHNYIKDYGLNLFDGAGYYTTGNAGGSTVRENLFEGVGNCYGSIYADGGSGDTIFENNVLSAGNQGAYMFNMNASQPDKTNTAKDIIARYNYGSNTGVFSGSGAVGGHGIIVEAPTQIVPGQETGKAKEIVENAGLTDEYKHLVDELKDGDLGLTDKAKALEIARAWSKQCGNDIIMEHLVNAAKESIEYMLANGSFGSGENDFPGEYKAELEAVYKELEDADYENMIASVMAAMDVIDRARSVVGTSSVTNDEIGLVSVSASDAESTEYDYDNRVATIYFGVGTDVSDKELNITVAKGCEKAYDFYNVKMNKDLIVPIYHTDSGKYEYWTVKIRESEKYIADTSEASWNMASGGRAVKVGDELYVRSQNSSIMHKSCMDPKNPTVIEFRPTKEHDTTKLSFVLGALKNTPFSTKTTLAKFDRTELVFTESECALYSVNSGNYSLIEKVSDNLIKWGEKNTLEISKTGTNLDRITVKLNGVSIFNEIEVKSKGNYFGFYGDNVAMYF